MFGLAPSLIRRLGLLCLMLLTIAAALPASEALACGPTTEPDTAASTVLQTDPATVGDGCGDCALSCTHGCCHASHVGILGGAVPPLPMADKPAPKAWTHDTGQHPAFVGGPKRPPRI